MFSQERIELDIEYGSYRNEFEAAFDSSRIASGGANCEADAMIALWRRNGNFVVVATYTRYCRHTDAIIGEGRSLAFHSASSEDIEDWMTGNAQGHYESEIGLKVLDPIRRVEPDRGDYQPTAEDWAALNEARQS